MRLAVKRGCKFIEVSAFLDHRVDELLAGVVAQVRLRHHPGAASPLAETNAVVPTPRGRYAGGGRRRRLRRLLGELWARWTGRCLTVCRTDFASVASNCDNLFLP